MTVNHHQKRNLEILIVISQNDSEPPHSRYKNLQKKYNTCTGGEFNINVYIIRGDLKFNVFLFNNVVKPERPVLCLKNQNEMSLTILYLIFQNDNYKASTDRNL